MELESVPKEIHEVIVVGAGVAGLTAALAAVEAGAKTPLCANVNETLPPL